MINYKYQLISPKKIAKKVFDEDIKNKVIVKPTYMSICAADARYYFGKRDNDILNQKLPMSLIHEAVGEILTDNTNHFKKGTKVVLLPHLNYSSNKLQNYDQNSIFLSSNADGFMQEKIVIDHKQIVDYANIPDEVAVFCELLSVAIHAINSNIKALKIANTIGIWGSGNLGYLLHLYLSTLFPNKKIYIFGTNDDNLELFGSANKRINIYKDKLLSVDFAFEAVGGSDSAKAINQIIDIINPTGTICLLGVSEDLISINTRKILEKGLIVMGRSRSTYDDFILAIKFLKNKSNQAKIKKIISKIFEIRTIDDICKAFEYDYTHNWKTLLKWEM